jgi:hypothetical protein
MEWKPDLFPKAIHPPGGKDSGDVRATAKSGPHYGYYRARFNRYMRECLSSPRIPRHSKTDV